MPRKKATKTTKPTNIQETPKEQASQNFIPAKKLKDLLASGRSTKQDVDEIVGTHRELIGQAVEKYGLNKISLAMLKRLDRLEPAQLNDARAQLLYGLEVTGLNDRAASAPRLEMGEAIGAGEDESNVRQLHAAE